SRVIVNVLVVLVQDFYLPLRRTLRLVEDRHQMRLRRLHIRPPPALLERVGVIIEQEQMLAASSHQRRKASVLRASNATVLRQAHELHTTRNRDRRRRMIIHHNQIRARGVLLDASDRVIKHRLPVERRDRDTDPRPTCGPDRLELDTIDRYPHPGLLCSYIVPWSRIERDLSPPGHGYQSGPVAGLVLHERVHVVHEPAILSLSADRDEVVLP